MEPGPYVEVPMTEAEKAELRDMYQSKRRMMITAYSVLFVIALIVSPKGTKWFHNTPLKAGEKWDSAHYDDTMYVSKVVVWLINFGWLEGILVTTGLVHFIRKVRPYRIDAERGMKEKVYYRIKEKEYDRVGQYYVALDDGDYLHHLMDEDSYYQCKVGDHIFVYRGPKSGYIFQPNIEPVSASLELPAPIKTPERVQSGQHTPGAEPFNTSPEPLTAEDRAELMSIYNATMRDLLKYLPLNVLFFLAVLFTGLPEVILAVLNGIAFNGERTWLIQYNSPLHLKLKVSIAIGLIVWTSVVVYRKKLQPFKKDAADGQKRKVAFAIVSKSYYPVTAQYMFRLGGVSNLVEVDESTYNSYAEGDNLYFYQATQSKHVFNATEGLDDFKK